MEFGERLKETLTWKGITQTEFAKIINVKKCSVTDWIKGRSAPNLELFCRICLALNETPNYFLGFDD